jgi:hypothetical protein
MTKDMTFRTSCPVCSHYSGHYKNVDNFDFFECSGCGIIHLDPAVIADIDQGKEVRSYDEHYWQMELVAARERARSSGIARIAEAIFYCQRPVNQVIDIGTGAGYLLDEMKKLLPKNACRIWGVELFPPLRAQRTRSRQYVQGTIATLINKKFDAGLCMEVVEHLTPNMVRMMLKEIAERSNDRACYVFNTGLANFVKNSNPDYIDPTKRGHIVSWTVEAFDMLGKEFGLRARALPGRDWAFLVEKTETELPSIESRMRCPLKENLAFLGDGEPGNSLLSILVHYSTGHFLGSQQVVEQTNWALQLNAELYRAKTVLEQLRGEYEQRTEWALRLNAELDQAKTVLEQSRGETEQRTEWARGRNTQLLDHETGG